MSTIVAPAKPGFAPPRGSPLNPQALHRSTPTPRSLRTDPRTHLSNLDRLLLKKSPPPPPPPQPAQDRRPAKEPIGDENEQHGYGEPGGGIFHALNLNTIIPSLRKASTEAMSPRSLAQLQRLLSSPRLSPKNPIASRWRLLHGASDWDGLLDPLDENLRRELTRYGDLVQAAYHAFHSNPAAAPHHRRDVILPDRSYRVTKSLYATSSVDLPRWVAGAVAPWMTQRSSWFGYVAVCDNEREIGRMGRRDVVIALRGTATCLEWAENFRAGLVPLESGEEDDDSKVANGFLSLYKTSGPGVPSLSAMVVEEVRRLTELYKGEELSITITGHSLGGAIALLVADELTTRLPQAPPIAVFSFGGPKVGNRAFADRLDKKGVKALRVVNSNDVVPRVPGVLPREELGRRIGRPMDGYAHFGAELRVDSRSSPYLKPDADPNCCHDLESYLHLVDGFVDRDCPFRSDAKRSLVRLFELQRPNLKKLCVTQARAMGLDRLEAPAALASPSQVGYLASPSA